VSHYSIKRNLIIAVLAGTALVLLVAAVFLDVMIGFQMQKVFDSALLDKAQALQTLVRTAPDGVEFEFTNETLPGFDDQRDAQYFQLWQNESEVIARSRSLGDSNLPQFEEQLSQYTFHDIRLPDGRPGRMVEILFLPRLEVEDEPGPGAVPAASQGVANRAPATLVVARERVTLQQERTARRAIIAGAMLTILIASAVLTNKFVSSGLLPLERLAGQVRDIDARSLDSRITHEGPQSVELAPIEQQINNLLARLESAFQRERRFSADVTHELRTPLAELKTLAEVGRQQPTDRATVLNFFADIEDISGQMENLVTTLLELARADAGQLQIVREDLALASLVNTAPTDSVGNAFTDRQFRNEIAVDFRVRTDREKLKLILRNLLSNAATYSPPGAVIRVFVAVTPDGADLTVENPVTDLESYDIQRMQQRFWRKEEARSDPDHSGLGLSLVDALAGALGLQVRLQLDENRLFRVTLHGLEVCQGSTESADFRPSGAGRNPETG
jgi:two-component system, OmpR family, heavy metal sensor histidine kinase CusS